MTSEDARRIRAVICDDRRLLREAVGRYLADSPHVSCVRLAADGDDAVREVRAGADVLVFNIRHAGDVEVLDVLEALSNLNSSVPVLVVGSRDDADIADQALAQGAAGFVREDAGPAALYRAMLDVIDSRVVLADYLASPTLRNVGTERGHREQADHVLSTLTQRERTVLLLLTHGVSRQQIAQRLGLSVNTVRTHIASVLRKLGVHTQLAAAIRGQELFRDSLTRAVVGDR